MSSVIQPTGVYGNLRFQQTTQVYNPQPQTQPPTDSITQNTPPKKKHHYVLKGALIAIALFAAAWNMPVICNKITNSKRLNSIGANIRFTPVHNIAKGIKTGINRFGDFFNNKLRAPVQNKLQTLFQYGTPNQH